MAVLSGALQNLKDARSWDDGNRAVSHVIAALGFACLIGWELSMVFAPSLPLLSYCDLKEGLLFRVVSVLALVVSYSAYAWKADWAFRHRNRLFTTGSLMALITVFNTCANLAIGTIPSIVSVFAWIFIGIAQASIAMYWCVFFSLAPRFRSSLVIPIGAILGTFLYVFVNSSGIEWVNLLGVVLMILGSVGIAAYLSVHLPAEATLPIEEYRQTSTLSPKSAFSVTCQGIVYGFMAVQSCSMGFEAVILVGASGLLGVSLALVWGLLGSRVDIDVGIIQRISLPPLVASMLLFPFFGEWGRIACACLANIALAHSTVFSWYSTTEENYEFRLHPIRRLAIRHAPSQAGFFVGSVLAFVLVYVADITAVSFSLIMAVMAIVVVSSFSIYGGDESKTKAQLNGLLTLTADTAVDLIREQDGGTDPTLPSEGRAIDFDECCERVSSQYALTQREGEVLRFLAKGRNAAYIANALCVSPATVKSHIYHIYQKLGVSSQQKLLDIVDDFEAYEN